VGDEVSTTSSSGGVGFAGLLTIAFIVLKLAGFIAWSWWWVLSPLWISAGLALALLAVCGVVVLVIAISDLNDTRIFKRGARARAQRLIERKR